MSEYKTERQRENSLFVIYVWRISFCSQRFRELRVWRRSSRVLAQYGITCIYISPHRELNPPDKEWFKYAHICVHVCDMLCQNVLKELICYVIFYMIIYDNFI